MQEAQVLELMHGNRVVCVCFCVGTDVDVEKEISGKGVSEIFSADGVERK
jgi:hypothetical protein